jgi:SPP1 gp7 family putative phage head morphogenesis protein
VLKREKEVFQALLNDEEAVIKDLEKSYARALRDIETKIKILQADEMTQSKIYQVQYQKALKAQIEGIMEKLHGDNYTSVQQYLNECYKKSFVGTMYALHGQGMPVLAPIDQDAAVRAVMLDSHISGSLYEAMGVDTKKLKQAIRREISTGISTGASYDDIARNLRFATNAPLARTKTIVRTEGHRVQQASAADARNEAKKQGCDVLKQWDSTLDGNTRPTHRELDGQIRETDEPFEVDGKKADRPGEFGRPEEDINCRCVALTRARWGLDESELQTMKDRAKFFELDKTKNFQEFSEKYLKIPEKTDTIAAGVLPQPIESTEKHYKELLDSLKQISSNGNLVYNPVMNQSNALSESEIISALAGGDRTSGSCASVGLAYIGQKQGWNVLDFRDGESRRFFASSYNLRTLSMADGLKVLRAEGASSITVGNRLLKMCENGKEYYLSVGRHAAIVRKTDDGILQYLELQSSSRSGWINFNGNPRYTLKNRFGCSQTSGSSANYDFMIDLDDSDFETDDFRSLLGYINTTENEQRKGSNGTIK